MVASHVLALHSDESGAAVPSLRQHHGSVGGYGEEMHVLDKYRPEHFERHLP